MEDNREIGRRLYRHGATGDTGDAELGGPLAVFS